MAVQILAQMVFLIVETFVDSEILKYTITDTMVME
jgi:hypothetical protein